MLPPGLLSPLHHPAATGPAEKVRQLQVHHVHHHPEDGPAAGAPTRPRHRLQVLLGPWGRRGRRHRGTPAPAQEDCPAFSGVQLRVRQADAHRQGRG